MCVYLCMCGPPHHRILSLNLSAPPGASGDADAFKMVLDQVWFLVGLSIYGNLGHRGHCIKLSLQAMSVSRNSKEFSKHTEVFQQ